MSIGAPLPYYALPDNSPIQGIGLDRHGHLVVRHTAENAHDIHRAVAVASNSGRPILHAYGELPPGHAPGKGSILYGHEGAALDAQQITSVLNQFEQGGLIGDSKQATIISELGVADRGQDVSNKPRVWRGR